MTNRIQDLLKFLEESPGDPFLKFALTMEYKKAGDAAKALAGFQQLVAEHPDYVGTYYHYAKFVEGGGDKEQASAIYRQGMEVAQKLRNRHAYSELLGAYNLLRGDDDEDWDG
ncbi:hypothetical protein BC792_10728 [Sphingobacterium allocomposti]|uniref:Uncharacterized protein n=1 Tax=Sphingobacterium allocomposti TaxID=415956 RepID=A0A5S5DN68_9SPHI|nr:tetratricopeptide repeat protein [Sphingobacterium composti Yoo et al. 2007 non Ten et al. 2007]TYP96129.1 hypothetical protein BC792_10728 [Sphingobacterium composti Yoo et al. 2007 non Ten et al. 2007]